MIRQKTIMKLQNKYSLGKRQTSEIRERVLWLQNTKRVIVCYLHTTLSFGAKQRQQGAGGRVALTNNHSVLYDNLGYKIIIITG